MTQNPEGKKNNRIYIAIDLKSFYASVEAVERNLEPLTVNLVVADMSRTEKTICLAVSPGLKELGIPGRARLFEVVQMVKKANKERLARLGSGRSFTGKSWNAAELKELPDLAIDYIVAPPRMALYMEYSTRIYEIYLKYVSPEDIHVYSIDEVFMDVTDYLHTYRMTARELAQTIIADIYKATGITATGGIGTNLYLCKVAMDIWAKHTEPDENGVRIAELDERSYRENLWDHRPLTDFWRIGRGIAKKLQQNGLYTMGDIARCSLGTITDFHNEDLLYKLFGVNAELIIDHAWGWEPCTMEAIKAYRPKTNSLSSGQVLTEGYSFEKAKLVMREMADQLALDLVDKCMVTDQIVLNVGYDIENLSDPEIRKIYHGEVTADHYGRKVPKMAHGSINLSRQTSSARLIIEGAMELFDQIVDPRLLVRRMNITANQVLPENEAAKKQEEGFEQLDLFTDYGALKRKEEKQEEQLAKEKKLQEAMLGIKKRYGKNAILKGMNLEEGATAMERNRQIGGHRA